MSEQNQYLNLLNTILTNGVQSSDRTGVGTLSLFGSQMRFSLQDGKIPIFTTRKIFHRGAIQELLWMIRGDTDAKKLQQKNVHIWDGNTTRQFLDNRNLQYMQEGQIGTLYGFQMRNWGGNWQQHIKGSRTGIDQLQKVVQQIKNDPSSRRIVMSYWNVSQLDSGTLTPCHAFIQFRVNQKTKELDCQMYQRSVDCCCGLPLNVIFYSVLTILIAKITGYKPGEFIWTGGDVHIYSSHIQNAKIQIERLPFQPPIININKDIKSIVDIQEMCFQDFQISGYKSHQPLKYVMAI